jgi:hypothetical protein
MSDERWLSTQVMVTGQSSVALEGVEKGIPTFLCRWLGDPFSGYQRQLVRYGAGRLLESPEEILKVPEFLNATNAASTEMGRRSFVAGATVAKHKEYSTRIMGAGA